MLARLRDTLWVFLFPVSLVWALATWFRRAFYLRRHQFRSRLRVISVGNLHSGGSGKTPVVMALGRHFEHTLGSSSTVVLSRGYRGTESSRGARVTLSDSRGPAAYGDEPWMLASVTGLPVFVGQDRAKQLKAIEHSVPSARVVILDDGFQHLAVARDYDLVLVNVDRSPLDGFCLPLGDLREPFGSIAAASAILLVSDRGSYLSAWEKLLVSRFPTIPRFISERRYADLQPNGKRVLAFCGIAHPEAFTGVIESKFQGRVVKAYPDHHAYEEKDVAFLLRDGSAQDYWVTTEKDFAKAASLFAAKGVSLQVLSIEQPLPPDLLKHVEGALGPL